MRAVSSAGITNATTWTFATEGDAIAPTLLTTIPADGATGVLVDTNLIASFGEPITLTGAGTITITNLDDSTTTVIDLSNLPDPGAALSTSGSNLTIDLTADLGYGTNYAVLISADAITDLSASSNAFAGILDGTTWNFTTIPPEAIPPTILATIPADDTARIELSAALVASFDEPIALTGNGSITLTDLTDGSSTETLSPPSGPRVTVVDGTNLTIQAPGAGFENKTDFSVRISSDAIVDLSASPNAFAGIADDSTWNFRVVNTNLFVIKPV